MLGTWFRRREPRDERKLPVEQRLDELEGRIEYVWSALRKLRGRVTGGIRKDGAPDAEPGDRESDAPPELSPLASRQWELASLARARAAQTKGEP